MSKPVKTFGPYSPVRQAGNLYFVSGQVGVDMDSKVAPPGVAEQTAKALDNINQLLIEIGLTLADVIKTTIFVTNMGDFATVNEVYMRHFPEPRPARSTVAVKELPRVATNCPVLVEIDAIAAKQEIT